VIAMSRAFNAFPNGAQIAGPPPRKTVEYGTGIVVSEDGAVITDRQVTDDCIAITIGDHEFFARLRALGERAGQPAAVVDELRVEPSTRRYDRWPTWRMVWWQNPITARLFLDSPRFWRHWYATTVR